MTKIEQFCNKFDVFYFREDSPWIGGVGASQAVEHSCPRGFWQEPLVHSIRRDKVELGHDCLGGWGFP